MGKTQRNCKETTRKTAGKSQGSPGNAVVVGGWIKATNDWWVCIVWNHWFFLIWRNKAYKKRFWETPPPPPPNLSTNVFRFALNVKLPSNWWFGLGGGFSYKNQFKSPKPPTQNPDMCGCHDRTYLSRNPDSLWRGSSPPFLWGRRKSSEHSLPLTVGVFFF